jgi:hypothetical protein
VVLDNLTVYQGGFSKGKLHGLGTLSLPGGMASKRLLSSSSGFVLVGTWDNGVLASCSDAGACRIGYNPQIAIPLVERIQSTLELKLDALFQNLGSMFKKTQWASANQACKDKGDEVCDLMAAFKALSTFVGGPFDIATQLNYGVVT